MGVRGHSLISVTNESAKETRRSLERVEQSVEEREQQSSS